MNARTGPALALCASLAALASGSASAQCGDGSLDDLLEECDDGNVQDGDGCSGACALECREIGAAATHHTCTHANYGPYDTAAAQEFAPGAFFGTVDTPHTHYTVSLPASAAVKRSAVSYFPTTRGTFAIYTKGNIPLEVVTESLEPVAQRIEHAIATCSDPSSLTWVRVFDLSDDAPYSLVFGPTEASEAVLVIERLTSFKLGYLLDADGDGFGKDETVLWSWCPVQGRVEATGDCDDATVSTYPGAEERCNGVDDDCDPETIEVCDEVDAGGDDAGADAAVLDGGADRDAGAGPREDGGAEGDAGTPPGETDAGAVLDAGAAFDAGGQDEDSSSDPDAGRVEPTRRRDSSGCQMTQAGSNQGGILWTSVAMLACLARGRRGRGLRDSLRSRER
jgi:cysteine-rich repeat protein